MIQFLGDEPEREMRSVTGNANTVELLAERFTYYKYDFTES
jgi:hypothetical protein